MPGLTCRKSTHDQHHLTIGVNDREVGHPQAFFVGSPDFVHGNVHAMPVVVRARLGAEQHIASERVEDEATASPACQTEVQISARQPTFDAGKGPTAVFQEPRRVTSSPVLHLTCSGVKVAPMPLRQHNATGCWMWHSDGHADHYWIFQKDYQPAPSQEIAQWILALQHMGVENELSWLTHISEFPTGYRLWTLRSSEGRRSRVYELYGHPSGQAFRNPMALLPHLIWLQGGGRHENNGSIECKCWLCHSRPPGAAWKGLEKAAKKKKDMEKRLRLGACCQAPFCLRSCTEDNWQKMERILEMIEEDGCPPPLLATPLLQDTLAVSGQVDFAADCAEAFDEWNTSVQLNPSHTEAADVAPSMPWRRGQKRQRGTPFFVTRRMTTLQESAKQDSSRPKRSKGLRSSPSTSPPVVASRKRSPRPAPSVKLRMPRLPTRRMPEDHGPGYNSGTHTPTYSLWKEFFPGEIVWVSRDALLDSPLIRNETPDWVGRSRRVPRESGEADTLEPNASSDDMEVETAILYWPALILERYSSWGCAVHTKRTVTSSSIPRAQSTIFNAAPSTSTSLLCTQKSPYGPSQYRNVATPKDTEGKPRMQVVSSGFIEATENRNFSHLNPLKDLWKSGRTAGEPSQVYLLSLFNVRNPVRAVFQVTARQMLPYLESTDHIAPLAELPMGHRFIAACDMAVAELCSQLDASGEQSHGNMNFLQSYRWRGEVLKPGNVIRVSWTTPDMVRFRIASIILFNDTNTVKLLGDRLHQSTLETSLDPADRNVMLELQSVVGKQYPWSNESHRHSDGQLEAMQ